MTSQTHRIPTTLGFRQTIIPTAVHASDAHTGLVPETPDAGRPDTGEREAAGSQHSARPPATVHHAIGRAATVTLAVGTVLAAVSTIVDPRSPEPEPRGLYVAYGADPAGADVAATVLHYGFLAIGIGLLLTGLAVARGRGRALAAVGGALGALGFVNLSGSVLEDWYDAQMAAALGPDQAMAIGQRALAMPALTAGWSLPMTVGFALGPVLLAVGLARAGLLGWWASVVPVAATVLLVLAQDLGPAGFLTTLALYAVFAVLVGRGLWRAPR